MKDIKWYRAWDIVYPVGIYYVLMNVATFVVCLIVPLTDESYGFIKVLTTLFVLPVVYVMYRNDQLTTKEDTEFVESIKEDVKWLGADWKDHLYFASDYFDRMYECAVRLIKKGKAFVCDLTAEEMFCT